VAHGPLAVRFGALPPLEPHAGTVDVVRIELENAGAIRWRDDIHLAYHWLDDRDNPIVWDGIRTPLPGLDPGERAVVDARVRGPIPPGRYRLAFDLVAEHRAWFSELGSDMLSADVEVRPRPDEPNAILPAGVEPAPDWHERVRAAHAEGYAVVAGAVAWGGSVFDRRPRALAPYEPGKGRMPGFAAPLICPSVAVGVELDRLTDVAGLPAFAAPRSEPWVFDGRIVLHVVPRGRGRSELDSDAVIRSAKDERTDDERGRGDDEQVEHVGEPGRMPEPQ
jgi:hypothetical protein